MTIAGRFRAALVDAGEPGLTGPELLPVRLARATARVLRVDGAGLSVVDPSGRRLPLGASSEPAEVAERLQFSAGRGPCETAQQTGQPVFAVEEDLHRRWPVFTDLLVAATPYRAVVALPLPATLVGSGAVDLYFTGSAGVPGLDVFEAMAVGGLITSALSDAAVWSEWAPAEGPGWLQGPVPRRRAAVWEALGKLSVHLEVPVPAALDLLRAHAYGMGRPVDDLAEELLSGLLHPADLQPREPG